MQWHTTIWFITGLSTIWRKEQDYMYKRPALWMRCSDIQQYDLSLDCLPYDGRNRTIRTSDQPYEWDAVTYNNMIYHWTVYHMTEGTGLYVQATSLMNEVQWHTTIWFITGLSTIWRKEQDYMYKRPVLWMRCSDIQQYDLSLDCLPYDGRNRTIRTSDQPYEWDAVTYNNMIYHWTVYHMTEGTGLYVQATSLMNEMQWHTTIWFITGLSIIWRKEQDYMYKRPVLWMRCSDIQQYDLSLDCLSYDGRNRTTCTSDQPYEWDAVTYNNMIYHWTVYHMTEGTGLHVQATSLMNEVQWHTTIWFITGLSTIWRKEQDYMYKRPVLWMRCSDIQQYDLSLDCLPYDGRNRTIRTSDKPYEWDAVTYNNMIYHWTVYHMTEGTGLYVQATSLMNEMQWHTTIWFITGLSIIWRKEQDYMYKRPVLWMRCSDIQQYDLSLDCLSYDGRNRTTCTSDQPYEWDAVTYNNMIYHWTVYHMTEGTGLYVQATSLMNEMQWHTTIWFITGLSIIWRKEQDYMYKRPVLWMRCSDIQQYDLSLDCLSYDGRNRTTCTSDQPYEWDAVTYNNMIYHWTVYHMTEGTGLHVQATSLMNEMQWHTTIWFITGLSTIWRKEQDYTYKRPVLWMRCSDIQQYDLSLDCLPYDGRNRTTCTSDQSYEMQTYNNIIYHWTVYHMTEGTGLYVQATSLMNEMQWHTTIWFITGLSTIWRKEQDYTYKRPVLWMRCSDIQQYDLSLDCLPYDGRNRTTCTSDQSYEWDAVTYNNMIYHWTVYHMTEGTGLYVQATSLMNEMQWHTTIWFITGLSTIWRKEQDYTYKRPVLWMRCSDIQQYDLSLDCLPYDGRNRTIRTSDQSYEWDVVTYNNMIYHWTVYHMTEGTGLHVKATSLMNEM